MGYDISVLRAILRLARRRLGADLQEIGLRVTGGEPDVRAAIRRLERAGLVEAATGGAVRLTMAGLTVAVASLPRRAPSSRAAIKPRVVRKRMTKRRAA
jgi:Mn-dependent DtxR family transcriptional regulator